MEAGERRLFGTQFEAAFHSSSSRAAIQADPLAELPPFLLSAMSGEVDSEIPQIDPRILIFLLYMVILQELVSGWMEYKKLACKPKKQPGPVWSSSYTRSSSRISSPQLPINNVRRDRPRDYRKPGRIVRKA
ncbi:uncharacterized protein WCC33_014728 [Rhinophrynus dorsalis]